MIVQALILAAGKSTRFNTSLTKLSYTICGQEMIAYPLQLLSQMNIPITVVVGSQKELVSQIVKKYQPTAECIEQTVQKGTGHAVLCTKAAWHADSILILNGDLPLFEQIYLEQLISQHTKTDATISLITAYNADPSVTGYGRVITNENGISIVEQREFKGNPEEHCRLNAGIYLIKREFLESTLENLEPHLPHGEIYITDLVKKASEQNKHIELVDAPFDTVRGVNTLKELWIAEHIKKSELISYWMSQGVRFLAPQSVNIDLDVTIGADSVIGCGVSLRAGTRIGRYVHIEGFSIIEASHIDDGAIVHSHSVVSHSHLQASSAVGPFAHIRRSSTIGNQAVIGNFVEVSRSTIGPKTKAKHLAYLGNTQAGAGVNIGAGAITCNYNGVSKQATTIEDNAFIGTNCSLIAPVTIGEGALVAAGSVITHDVAPHALAISRSPQINKEQYAPRLKERYKQAQSAAQPSSYPTKNRQIQEEVL